MAPDDSTRCLRCRSPKSAIVDDGSNPPFRLCRYCQQALAGTVIVINSRPEMIRPRIQSKTAAKRWRSRKLAKGR